MNGRIIWLYSANFDSWYIYDYDTGKHLNRIYQDYIIRKNLVPEFDPFGNVTPCTPPVQSNSRGISHVSSEYVLFDNDIESTDDSCDYNRGYTTYIIEVADGKYYIDLDRMRQIDCQNLNRQKRIDRIEIPGNVGDNSVTPYLKNVLGLNILDNL
jgi:hypothetical protein